MSAAQTAAFDKIATTYDTLWSNTTIGRLQRQAVWERIDPLFKADDFVLDLGCGTGVDSLHLQARGVRVYAVDGSPKMTEMAASKGVNARCLRVEDLHRLGSMQFDGVLSNFGVLNCVPSLSSTASVLGRIIRPGGYMALCFLGRRCAWETGYYLLQGKPGKAFRRFHAQVGSSLGTDVFYPSRHEVSQTFGREFRLLHFCGIGVCVPPSYVHALGDRTLNSLAALDRRIAQQPALRSLADHALYIFQRL